MFAWLGARGTQLNENEKLQYVEKFCLSLSVAKFLLPHETPIAIIIVVEEFHKKSDCENELRAN